MPSAVLRAQPAAVQPATPVLHRASSLMMAATLLLAGRVAAGAAGELVLSQVYGGGGNSGAPFRNDFVEVFNRGSNLVSLAGWTVQYAASAGVNWQSAPLNGSLAPGQYFLLQLASGGVNGAALPTPDATGSMNLSAGNGKVALVGSTTLLSGVCPPNDNIADLIGYGNSTSCFEGGGTAAGPANLTAAIRASGGCLDRDDNALDFFVASPAPRNRNSPVNVCPHDTVPLAPHTIQGRGARSAFAGQFVTTTTNIITGIRNNGFFIQAPDNETDSAPETSEALFVSMPDELPAPAQLGNAVVVAGIVEEYRPNSDPAVPPRTQLINANVSLMATGRPRPAARTLTPADLDPAGATDQLERLESMRVHVSSLRVVAPTEGFPSETNATSTSDGVFYGVLTGAARPFREPGIPIPDPLPPGAPAGVPRFDINPERLRVDSNAQPGAPRLEVTAGAIASNLTGVLDFEERTWTILPDAGAAPVISGNIAAIPVPVAGSNEFTVASFNLERFFDSTDDPLLGEPVLTTAAFNGRLNKASLAIRNVLRSPDILGVIEVENLATLQTLAGKVNGDAVVAGQPNPDYQAWLEEGNDIGGIDVGFLIKGSRVVVLDVVQHGKTDTYQTPAEGQLETLHDRPPLVLRALVPRPGSTAPLAVTVVVTHLRSMGGIDDSADGARVRAKRRAQAEHLASLIQQRQTAPPNENLVVVGDFNAFPFTDGYVDVLGTIQGDPAPPDQVTLASTDLVTPDLVNATGGLPAEQRYSFSFDGNAQALDHILVSESMRSRVVRCVYGRSNADFPESYRSNFNRPERLSDHDAPVAFFSLNLGPRGFWIERLSGERIRLQWIAEPAQTNRVETSVNLRDWTLSATVVTDGIGAGSFTGMTSGGASHSFYRVAAP